MVTNLTTQPYKGARDFYPEDMIIRNYMFNTWRKTLMRFGFEEYDFPILEPLEIFSAKSGAEIVNEQLFSFEDKGGRKLAMRPEITPGTVRMIAQKYKQIPQPIKWFMIGNNWRYEKPQSGRGREFYQLEVNTFGVESIYADFEIFSIIVALMKEFGATQDQFEIQVSDRRLINALLGDVLNLNTDMQVKTRRLMDKRNKLTQDHFISALLDIGLEKSQAEITDKFMTSSFERLDNAIPTEILNKNLGYLNIKALFQTLKQNDLMKYCRFDASIIRGFDYSDGLVYEVFDKNPQNKRSMFGGERFDKLINIFGDFELPATGFAMGDYTLLEFLTYWKLLPNLQSETQYLVTVWPNTFDYSSKVAQEIRNKGVNVFLWPDDNTKLDKQLKYADKKSYSFAIICGEEERNTGNVGIKNLKDGTQKSLPLNEFLAQL